MTKNRLFNHCLICALILVTGLGFALALPWLASSQGLSAQSMVGTQYNAPQVPTIYYVAITGTALNPTIGWSGAFTNLQDALAVAEDPSEIWVAEGVYYPDIGSGQINNSPTSTFLMTDGVAIYGGFKFGDTQLSDRDWRNNQTVLSGDIDGNDADVDGVVMAASDIKGNNAYHVVTGRGVTETAVLDGFTITAGNANSELGSDWDLHLSDANGGGIICFDGCNIRLNHVSFSGNKAKWNGGAMYIFAHENDNYPSFKNMTFYGNSALYGGAIYSDAFLYGLNAPYLVNVTFSKNVANENGGAIYQYGFAKAYSNSTVKIRNATFSGNSAGELGGAIYNELQSHSDVINSILWNNQDSSGEGTISSSIYNEPRDFYGGGSSYVENSLIQGTGGSRNWPSIDRFTDGGGNIDTNPLFVKDPYISTISDSVGNLRLQARSPAIDAGINTHIAGVTSDLDGKPRIQDGDGDGVGTVDMGAYEAEAKTERHYKLNIYPSGSEFGQVLSSPEGIDCGDTCSLLLKENSTITIMAFPEYLSTFTGWSDACSGTADCVLIMDSAKNVLARFLPLLKFPIAFR